MSDDNTPEAGGEQFRAITSQEELVRILDKRLERERAKFAGFEDFKAKAAEYDKATEAAKTEQQKLLDRATAAEKRVAEFEQREQVAAWAQEVVKGSTIPASVLRGSTKEELEAHFEQLKAIAAPAAPAKRTAVPPGKSEKDQGGSRAVAALRQYRAGVQ